jgi:hypothetical protein
MVCLDFLARYLFRQTLELSISGDKVPMRHYLLVPWELFSVPVSDALAGFSTL